MAVKFTAPHSRTSEYRILPEDITIKPELNGRHDLPDIECLIQDILINGQHTPVVIRNDGGNPVLCAGFSRYRAVSEINKRKLLPQPIQLRCTYTQCSEEEGFLAAISENRMRNETTELDDAYNIGRLMRIYAKTEEQVALIYFPGAKDESLKKAVRFVKQRLSLINLSPAAEKAMKDGRLKGSAAVAIAKLSQDQQKEVMAKAPAIGKISAPKKAPVTTKATPPGFLKLLKAVFSDVAIDELEADDNQFVEVNRKALLELHKAVFVK
jgi:ParB-like chromosome segregation protein Spo0J